MAKQRDLADATLPTSNGTPEPAQRKARSPAPVDPVLRACRKIDGILAGVEDVTMRAWIIHYLSSKHCGPRRPTEAELLNDPRN